MAIQNNELPERFYPLIRHREQIRLIRSTARFKVVPAGRRSGKTERAKRWLIQSCLNPRYLSKFPEPRYAACAPTRDQAKQIWWQDIKDLSPKIFVQRFYDGELRVRFHNGAEIHIIGLDRPERIEGRPWDGVVLDEFANMKPQAWSANVRPALSDRNGWAWLIGVPEGRNHYYDMYRAAQADQSGEWSAFTWPSSDILPIDEIASAKRDLDDLTFQQEYQASFVNFHGRAYYNFSDNNVARLKYDPQMPLAFCFDFNVAPGVASVIQEQMLPNGQYGTGVIDEVYIPQNSNTVAVCRKLMQLYGNHDPQIVCYGDSTGGSGGSAQINGSDWDLIRKFIREHYRIKLSNTPLTWDKVESREKIRFRLPRHNPRERVRLNAINARIKSSEGVIRFMVDPKCIHTIRDFEGVRLLEGGSGEIDKKHDLRLTHLTDAIGYYVNMEFPTAPQHVMSREINL